MELRSGIEVDFAFASAFSEHDAFPFVEIDVRAVEPDQLSYSHAGRNQRVYNGEVSRGFSMSSSENVSFTVRPNLTLWMRRTGLFRIYSSSSNHEKKLENMRRMLSIVTLLEPRRA